MKLVEMYKRSLKERDDLHNVNTDMMGRPSVDPSVEEESAVVLLIDKLEEQPDILNALRNLNLLSSKYKAIMAFANLLGIKQEQFHAVMQQAKIQS